MEPKKTLTAEDRPGWYECEYVVSPGNRVIRHWQGGELKGGPNGAHLSLVDYQSFVGPLFKPGEALQAADDPEVIDRIIDRVSDALREMGVGDLGKYHPHLEIVKGLRARLLRKPLVLPEPGTAFKLRTFGMDGSATRGAVAEYYRFKSGEIVNECGTKWTEEMLANARAELVETQEE